MKRDGRKDNPAEASLLKRIRELERELLLKDKALKEATALLVLKKKAESLFPAHEDEEPEETTDKPQSTLSKKPTKVEHD